MAGDLESRLLVRARELDDRGEELAEEIAGVHARARKTRLDQASLRSLVAAARTLADSAAMPPPPAAASRPSGYRSEEELIDDVLDAEDGAVSVLRSAARLRLETDAALAAALAAQARAALMPADTPAQRTARRHALADARSRIAVCREALDVLAGIRDRFGEARQLLRRVPRDLGDVYQIIYDLLSEGRRLPEDARTYFGAIGGSSS
jgi:hypothetical protein